MTGSTVGFFPPALPLTHEECLTTETVGVDKQVAPKIIFLKRRNSIGCEKYVFKTVPIHIDKTGSSILK